MSAIQYKNTKSRSLTASGIFLLAFVSLISGHLLLKEYMPIPALGAIGFTAIFSIYFYVLFIRNDFFGYILLVYICSHFSYADNQGGIWNLMTFGMLVIYLGYGSKRELFRHIDLTMLSLLFIFVIWNVLGWGLNNPMPILPRLLGIATFFGFILMFNFSSNIIITKEHLRLFLTVTFFMLLYQTIVAINQRYQLVNWNTPLIGAYSKDIGAITYGTTNAKGTLRHSELFGEYAALMVCLLLPLLSSSFTQKVIRININQIVLMIFLSLACIMLTSTRSAALLVVFVIFSYFIVFSTRMFASIDRVGRQLRVILIVFLLTPIIGIYIGIDSIEEDFTELENVDFSVENVISGKAINRGPLTEFAIKRIHSESWLIGNGFGTPRANLWAWIGTDPEKLITYMADYHNMYLSLPMLYGWVGSIAFLLMIFITFFRVFNISLRYRNRKSYLLPIALGFTMFWFVFLVDQYKISILRNPNYHMMFWIWLGLTNAIVKTIRIKKIENC